MRIVKLFLSALALTSLLSTFSFAAQPDRITGTISSANMVALKNNVLPLAKPQFDQGPIAATTPISLTMLITPSAAQRQALVKLIADQQNPASGKFHKWLTPETYANSFGLSRNDMNKIQSWLEAQGFKVTYLARGRDYVTFSGNVGQVESTFRTQMHTFKINGKTYSANATSPQIPAALVGVVGGFRGLHTFLRRPQHRRAQFSITVSGQTANFLAPGDLATIYDIGPLYKLSTPIDGTGQKIVIVGQTDVYLDSINDYRNGFSLNPISGCTPTTGGVITSCSSSSTYLQYHVISSDPLQTYSCGDLGEADLDLEVSGAVARNAQIIYVNSPVTYDSNCDVTSPSDVGVDASASYAVDNQLAPVISESYGSCEALNTDPDLPTQDALYSKAASEGISFFVAAGDSGAAECDGDLGNEPAELGLSVSYPSSSAYVTAVGGTEFNEGSGTYWNGSDGNGGTASTYIPEIAWNDTTLSVDIGGGLDATGGGPSNCANIGSTPAIVDGFDFGICDAPPNGGFAKPSYQTGVTPSDSVRDVPDIAFSASNANDPYLVCTAQSEAGGSGSTSTCATSINDAVSGCFVQNGICSAFGGTSAATPLAAGIATLLNQNLGTNGLGNINTELYKLYASNASVFHDITTGTNTSDDGVSNNIVPCTAGTPSSEITGFPSALDCPSDGEMGYAVAGGHNYSTVTGMGSFDVNALFGVFSVANFSLAVSPTSDSVTAGHTAPASGAYTVTITPSHGYNQATTLSCSGLTGATCTFNPASVTPNGTSAITSNLTISTYANTATGPATLTITATNGGSITQTATFALTVNATDQSFTLAAGSTTYTVSQGQTLPATVTLTGAAGFATPLVYSCTNDTAPQSQCNVSTSQAVTSPPTFNITTTAPTSELRSPFDRGARMFYAAFLPGLFGILFTFGSRQRRLRGLRMLSMILMLGASTLWLGSCSNSSSSGTQNSGTTPGSYAVTVNATTTSATGAGTAITGTTTINFTVSAAAR